MESFLHPLEYRRSTVVFQEGYEPSASAQEARETEKQEQGKNKKNGAGYTVAKCHHYTSSYQQAVTATQVKTLTLETHDVYKTPHVEFSEPPKCTSGLFL